MPKPLFTKLVAQVAIGLFCVLFGCVFSIQTKDKILLFMSLAIGICSIIRTVGFYLTVRTNRYTIIEGYCKKKEAAMFGKNQKFLITDAENHEYLLTLGKESKLLQGHSYRLYFRTSPDGNAASMNDNLLAYEEIPSLKE